MATKSFNGEGVAFSSGDPVLLVFRGYKANNHEYVLLGEFNEGISEPAARQLFGAFLSQYNKRPYDADLAPLRRLRLYGDFRLYTVNPSDALILMDGYELEGGFKGFCDWSTWRLELNNSQMVRRELLKAGEPWRYLGSQVAV